MYYQVLTSFLLVGLVFSTSQGVNKIETTEPLVTISSTDASKGEMTTSHFTTIPTTSASTTKPVTTPSTPTTSPTAATTTPTAATTTPTAATTTSPTTSMTTQASTTVKPEDNTFIVQDPTTKANCIIAAMKIKFDVPYNDSSSKAVYGHVEVPSSSHYTGSCNSSDMTIPQHLNIYWGNNSVVNFTFSSDVKKNEFYISSMSATFFTDRKNFPNITDEQMVTLKNDSQNFVTPLDSSYSCSAATDVPVELSPILVKDKQAFISLSLVHIQAFRNSTDKAYSAAIFCESSSMPDLVPILVGCGLALMAIIVLALYLINRMRNHGQGYLSM